MRSFRGSLNPWIPSWLPLRPWIANKRYQFYLSIPTRQAMETVPEFLAHAKEVVIDEVFDFEVSKTSRASLRLVVRC